MTFNQVKYQNEWIKAHSDSLNYRFDKEKVAKFKVACKKLNVSQRSIIEKAIDETIKKASHID